MKLSGKRALWQASWLTGRFNSWIVGAVRPCAGSVIEPWPGISTGAALDTFD
jgi:hypothetical protein